MMIPACFNIRPPYDIFFRPYDHLFRPNLVGHHFRPYDKFFDLLMTMDEDHDDYRPWLGAPTTGYTHEGNLCYAPPGVTY